MEFHYTQLFLLTWIILFWIHHFFSYGKVEAKFERSVSKEYEIKTKWEMFFGISFILFTLNILIYFFHYQSRDWFWSFSILDQHLVNFIAIFLMCFSFLLYFLFTASVGKTIKKAFNSGEHPKLITDGIYAFIRNPGYFAFYLAAFGCVLILHNLVTFLLFIYICTVVYGHTLEEEHKLIKIYGNEYEEYKRSTGRFFPKLVRK